MADDSDQLLAFLGVTAKSNEQVEKEVIDEALNKATDARPAGAHDGGVIGATRVQAALDNVSLEIEALQSALQTPAAAAAEGAKDEQVEGEAAKEVAAAPVDRALAIAAMQQRLTELQDRQEQLQSKLDQAQSQQQDNEQQQEPAVAFEDDNLFEQLAGSSGRMVETDRDWRVRLGLLTPFDNLQGYERSVTSASARPRGRVLGQDPRLDRRTNDSLDRAAEKTVQAVTTRHKAMLLDSELVPTPERAVRQMNSMFWRDAASSKAATPAGRKKRRASTLTRSRKASKAAAKALAAAVTEEAGTRLPGRPDRVARKRSRRAEIEKSRDGGEDASSDEMGGDSSDYVPSEDVEEGHERGEGEDVDLDEGSEVDTLDELDQSDGGGGVLDANGEFDDADEQFYTHRSKRLLALPSQEGDDDSLEEEVVFAGGFKVPGGIYHHLFDYQKTGVKWLWELYCQRAGGIMGDEMGLGKTIQVIAFLAGLHYSGMFNPSLVVCPATVLKQWLRELRTWYPLFRVLLFHDSSRSPQGSRPSRDQLADIARSSPTAVVVTTYDQLRIHRDILLGINWGVAVLDEGHKIRNPDSEITLVCKQISTVHRVIMSGSPIQNRLSELWSLFDFIFPGKLGTLPVFQAQFAVPIQIGGYANANKLQVSTAFKCAVILRDLITPYLLRRRKADVSANLPKKTEQVLFCNLTKEQRELYRAYLSSTDVSEILEGRRRALQGIDVLRKICNHPDILERSKADGIADYGSPTRSGKLVVTEKLLAHWKQGGSKALIFSQTQQMLDILECMVVGHAWRYHRMDGSTAVVQRSRLVDDFNNNPDVFCFLLTTKVGGIGVNLTGADKVLLYDPDWNPATDSQARERAWRIGQRRDVTVYRLITSGTIEEKVYHRQIYKNFLTNKILRDPRQKRFFTARDISDLFTLADENARNETANIFGSVEREVSLAAGGRKAKGKSKQGEKQQCGSWARSRGRASQEPSQGLEEDAGEVDEEQQGRDETKMLRDLFEGTGIRSFMDHDKIEGANDPEVVAMNQEAARLARKAAEALKNSRQACMTASINVPTWTGRHGAAGLPPPPPARKRFGTVVNPQLVQPAAGGANNFPAGAGPSGSPAPAGITRPGSGIGDAPSKGIRPGAGISSAIGSDSPDAGVGHFSGAVAGTSGGGVPSSAQLLEAVRVRQQGMLGAGSSVAAASVASLSSPGAPGPSRQKGAAGPSTCGRDSTDVASVLLTRILSFLEGKGGTAPTDELIGAFQDVPQARVPLFKQLLRQAAKLQKVNGVGVWKLKAEFETAPSGDL